jgi:CBS domain-containing protein
LLEQRLAREAVAAGVRGSSRPAPMLVGSFMSRRCVAVHREESPRRALKLLLTLDVRCLPVVEDGHLLGVVTSSDFLRELAYGESPLASDPVSRFVLPDEEAIESHAPLEAAKLAMESGGKSYIAVERGGVPLGVVSRRDLRFAKLRDAARAFREGDEDLRRPIPLAELVAEAPALRPGQPLRNAAALLAETNLQAVAVVNQAYRLVGVLSEDAILAAMLET